jgi:hypothetical protein
VTVPQKTQEKENGEKREERREKMRRGVSRIS